MQFEQTIEEQYRGFGQSGHINTEELRILYYGRLNLFISFTDEGDYDFTPSGRDLPRPEGIIAHPINDVVGKKVRSNKFYGNVFRANTSSFISDVRSYNRDAYIKDLTILSNIRKYDKEIVESMRDQYARDLSLNTWFEKLWHSTEEIASNMSGNFERNWKNIFMDMGYAGIMDTSGTGIIIIGRAPVILYFDYERRNDIDIVPIQKYRADPRARVADKVERRVQRMGVRRNRIAKRKVERYQKQNRGFTQAIRDLASSLGISL